MLAGVFGLWLLFTQDFPVGNVFATSPFALACARVCEQSVAGPEVGSGEDPLDLTDDPLGPN